MAIHGTGTPLGDPIEVNALSQPLAGQAGQTRPLAMLSNKACYGHTEGTAGITGLLLALQVCKPTFQRPRHRATIAMIPLAVASQRTCQVETTLSQCQFLKRHVGCAGYATRRAPTCDAPAHHEPARASSGDGLAAPARPRTRHPAAAEPRCNGPCIRRSCRHQLLRHQRGQRTSDGRSRQAAWQT